MIQSGYKQTEIGVIPEGWEVIPFSKCFDSIKNNTLSRAELNYDGGNIRNIHYGDVLIIFPSIVDCQKETIPYVNEDADNGVGNSFLQDGDVVIADTAEDNTVGKAVEIFNIGDSKVVAGLHTMPCRPKNKFAEKYLGYYINARVFHDQIIPFITGTKVSSISKKAIDDTAVLVPPLAEQKRIAEALSDVDELIASLEKLIEKKTALKQGVMQELLTGKRRFPGFTEGWDRINLGNLCNITTGKKDANEGNENGQYPFFTCSKEVLASNEFSFEGEAILVAGNGDVGNTHYYNGRFEAYQRTYVLMDFTVNIHYVLYFINQFLISNLTNNSFGSSIPYIVKEQLSGFQIDLPKYSLEINAIVDCIHSMENEILAMTSQLKKYKTIKSGMMSELLTGRIRLM